MSVSANEQLMRRWFEEVWNQQRVEVIDELLAADALLHGHVPELRGREAFKQLHATFCANKERFAQLFFERFDLMAHCRLREMQSLGGARKVECFGNGAKRAKLRHFHFEFHLGA